MFAMQLIMKQKIIKKTMAASSISDKGLAKL